ncbi:MAG: 30S ribosomal protein S4 [Planctomycetota bacterium]|nr:30S ribosomal protein S4 [Planctomycetota bacterium]
MGRPLGPRCRVCRREGEKLFLKGAKCDTRKCPLEKRQYPPGEHSYRKAKYSEYARRLRETQKVKRYYGVSKTQFERYFEVASRKSGDTGENLLIMLERRLDNIVHLIRWAPNRTTARQLIAHGHIFLNGRRHKSASYLVKAGDTISVVSDESIRKNLKANMEASTRAVPEWIQVDTENMKAVISREPLRSEVSIPVEAGYIVEFLSR